MVNNFLVSIIIPTYKRADLLPRAIDSALNQTYSNIEVLVIDDNNPESDFRRKTEDLMNKYIDDSRIIYVKHDKNKNGAAARNTGINYANGEFICFLDDDDWFLPNKIEKQLNYLICNTEFDGVYCGRYQNNKLVSSSFTGDLSEIILLSDFIPGPPTLMFHKYCFDLIKGFNESYRRHQDSELLLRFFEHYKLGSISEPLVIIGENLAENELHGLKLEELKNELFTDFSDIIDKINHISKNFKIKVYAKHYTQVFFDHIQNHYFLLAYKIFIKCFKKSHFYFLKYLLFRLFESILFKIKNL